jgi:hypothetical protein
MVRYFAASLRLNGGALADSRIVVTVGADDEPSDLYLNQPWSRRYNLEWRWLPRELFRQKSFFATALERFRYRFEAPMVVLVDADVFVSGPFDDWVARVQSERALGGLIAHVSPFESMAGAGSNREAWRRLFKVAGLGEPELTCEHTGWGALCQDERYRRCPPYFNLGVLIAPPDVVNKIGEVIYDEMAAADRFGDTFYKCQLALSLAIQRKHLSWAALPMKCNFPNDQALGEKYARDAEDVRLFHYLRIGAFDKRRDFMSPDDVTRMLARTDLTGVDRTLQMHLRRVHRQVLVEQLAA